jgi:pimeloyl-ACP methyl ester carboxylesterase
MKSHKISGGGGVQLHVVEAGNANGAAIVFIHGLSQSSLAWGRQINSDLANDYRLVAMDMRGHGFSDKPRDAYADSKLWADDVAAVIQTLNLQRPVLSGWSYGPLVILDYVRHYGEDSVGGINFVGGVTKLCSESALSVLTPEFLSLVPGFFSSDADESRRTLESLLRLCIKEISTEDLSLMLGASVSVPVYVRQGLLSRVLDNDDLLSKIRKPVLITHGAQDRVVKIAAVDQHRAGLPHAQVYMPNTGHTPFWDDAPAFNQRLREFCETVQRTKAKIQDAAGAA